MKALTIKEPFLWAILNAGKGIENRDWPLPAWMLDKTIALHASKHVSRDEYERSRMLIEEISGLRAPEYVIARARRFGFVHGTARVVGQVTESDDAWFFGDYGFLLDDRRTIATPIYCKGALGFWDVPAEIERRLKAAPTPSA